MEKATLQDQKDRLEKMGQVLEGNNYSSLNELVVAFGNNLQNGIIPESIAKPFIEALKSGNVERAIDTIIEQVKPDENDTSPEAEEKRKKLDALTGLKGGAKGLGLLALLAIAAVSIAASELKH